MWQIKTVVPWAHKFATRTLLLSGTTTMLAFLAVVAIVNAQVAIGITPARMCLRLLRLCTLRLRTQRLLWARLFLWRRLSGRGPMGELGLWTRLG